MKYILSLSLSVLLLLPSVGCGLASHEKQGLTEPTPQKEEQPETASPDEEEEVETVTEGADMIAVPDKIIYFHEGDQLTFNADDSKFDKILDLIKNRVSSAKDIVKLGYHKSDLETLKQEEDVIELIYSEEVLMDWKYKADRDFTYHFEYDSVVFPLTGDWSEFAFFQPTSVGPVGYMGPADELLTLLNS